MSCACSELFYYGYSEVLCCHLIMAKLGVIRDFWNLICKYLEFAMEIVVLMQRAGGGFSCADDVLRLNETSEPRPWNHHGNIYGNVC